MPRRTRAPQLETRSSRLKLPIAKKPAFVKIGLGIGLGYRRNQTVGTWIVRVADGKGANATKAFAIADDAEDADGTMVLTYWQAQDRAREISRADDSSDAPPQEPITIFHALEAYGADLKTRGGDIGNVARCAVIYRKALATSPWRS